MNARAQWATAPLDVGGWNIPDDREHRSAISVIDKAGRTVARVPRRDDDLDVARAIAALPDLLHAVALLSQTVELYTPNGAQTRLAFPLDVNGDPNLEAVAKVGRDAIRKAQGIE